MAEKNKLLRNFLFSFKYDLDVVKKAVENGADINAKNAKYDEKEKYKPTPLYFHYNAFEPSGEMEIPKYLLKNGADVNIKCGIEQNTVLHLALQKRDFHMAKLFLEHGADLKIKDAYGHSCWSYIKNKYEHAMSKFKIKNNKMEFDSFDWDNIDDYKKDIAIYEMAKKYAKKQGINESINESGSKMIDNDANINDKSPENKQKSLLLQFLWNDDIEVIKNHR